MCDKLTMGISSDSSVDDRWSKDLAHELVDMIVKRLCLFDSISCTAVCSSWRLVWKRRFGNQFPFILRSFPYQSYYSLYSPGEDRATNNLRFPKGVVDRDGTAPYCSGSCGGWLIIAEHNSQPHPKPARSYFFNQVSGARIALPPRSDPSFFVRDRRAGVKVFIKTVASSDPTDPNCIVPAIALHGYRVVFCRPNDASWTLQYPPNTPLRGGYGFTDLHFHEGELYATVGRMIDVVLIFDPLEVLFQSQSQGSYKGKLLGASPLEGHIVLRWKNMRNPSFCLITSSSGEMLLVLKEERERENDREVLLLVFKCKVTKNVDKTIREGCLKYEVMNNIGEQAIFIGNVGAKTLMAMAKSTNSMPVIDKLGGHGSGNCIDFTNWKG
uniref:uncharacterized protein LOC105351434 n=1 Tax=Fragaria vesca subsp. vesca TaxID=101020 RepID=UPI0005C91782|nr:PREDICTED: uncharacterized protein LOC105351434 [Fragaria vesca subsp. vesca]